MGVSSWPHGVRRAPDIGRRHRSHRCPGSSAPAGGSDDPPVGRKRGKPRCTTRDGEAVREFLCSLSRGRRLISATPVIKLLDPNPWLRTRIARPRKGTCPLPCREKMNPEWERDCGGENRSRASRSADDRDGCLAVPQLDRSAALRSPMCPLTEPISIPRWWPRTVRARCAAPDPFHVVRWATEPSMGRWVPASTGGTVSGPPSR